MRKHMPIFIVFFVTTLFVSTFAGEKEVSSQEENNVGPNEMYRFVFFSVFEGLFEDNVDQEVVQIVLQNRGDFFVPKCSICMPVEKAFAAYDACVGRNAIFMREESAESAKRISGEMKREFISKDRNTKLMALRDLVNRYVSSRFEMLKMSEKEKQDMQALIAKAREHTMKNNLLWVPKFGDFCASCDGACGIKKEK